MVLELIPTMLTCIQFVMLPATMPEKVQNLLFVMTVVGAGSMANRKSQLLQLAQNHLKAPFHHVDITMAHANIPKKVWT